MSGARILVVEDDGATRRALAILFTKMGLLTSEASTLDEAMRQVSESFDVICLDLLLPDGNGVELLRHVRDRKLRSKVAVISAANEPDMLAEVTALKPEAIFGKPLDIDDFLDWLRAQRLSTSLD